MYYAGVDLGSVACKCVVIDDAGTMLAFTVTKTLPDLEKISNQILSEALEIAKIRREDIAFVVGTGYGRQVVPFANDTRNEIMCHALGVHYLFPTVRTVIDIGGQDTKGARLNEQGRVQNFAMNERCAAGTGRWTEVMAKALETPFDKWGPLVASAASKARISSICTIFAETEVISLMQRKVPLNEVIAGVCDAIVTRTYQMVQKIGIQKDVAFTGGVANNAGMVQVLKEKLQTDLFIPKIPQCTGALGAAYFAKRFAEEKKAQQK